MNASQATRLTERDECDFRRCPAEGLIWMENVEGAILVCGHHGRSLFGTPALEGHWKNTGLPFDKEHFWEPVFPKVEEYNENDDFDDNSEYDEEEGDDQ